MNESGIWPKGDRVLIKPEEIQKPGLIEIPESIKDQHMTAQHIGVLVAAGEDAFTEYTEYESLYQDGKWVPHKKRVRGFSQPFAKEGDRVIYAKFAGIKMVGKDGETYRVLNDMDITGLAEEGVTYEELNPRKPVGEQR